MISGARDIVGAPSFRYIDVLPGTPDEVCDALVAVHREHFADYPHVADGIAKTWRDGGLDADIIEHQWLLLLDDEPAGEFLFQTNLRRRTVSRSHIALNRESRLKAPADWIPRLIDAAGDCASADAADVGIQLIAMMGEVSRRHVVGWRRMGYISPEIDYREPVHGNQWAAYGEPQFNPLAANILLLPAGADLPLSEVVTEAVSAFLLDYYRLPASHPVVVEILGNCARLGAAEPSV